jgi:hypothetical protein
MKFQFRVLPSSGSFRPQPTVYQSEDGKTLAIVTNWGAAAATEIVIQRIKAALSPVIADSDETRILASAVKKDPPLENKLAEAIRSANDDIYKAENASQWKTVVEVTVLHLQNGAIFWAQAGLPHVLMRTAEQVEFLSVSADPFTSASAALTTSPLPMAGIGLDEFPNVNSGSALAAEGSHLALLSLPGSLLSMLGKSDLSIDGILASISNLNPAQPLWVGVIEV